MSDRRRDAATATLGLSGVAGAGALRHVGLERAYGGGPRPKVPVFHEAKLLRTRRGRIPYLAGAALGLASVPTAAVGTSRLLQRRKVEKADDRRKSFLAEGVAGARDAVHERNNSIRERPPAKLVAGNYLAGAAIGTAAGALVHRAPALRRLPGAMRSGLAATAGVTAGSAALPLQSRLTRRASHGEYETTPTGVRRRKTKRVNASARASVVDGRPGRSSMHPVALRHAMVPSSDPFNKAYYGEDMSRKEKRARVAAAGSAPVVGDFAQAAAAARMAPPGQRASAAARQYSGGQIGGLVGQVGGAAGALGAAHVSRRVQRGAERVTDAVDRAESTARRAVRAPAKSTRPGMLMREARNPKAPRAVRAVLRPVARNPKVALAGALVGGAVGSQVGGQLGYGAALNAEQRYKDRLSKGANPYSRAGGARFAKAETTHPLSQREQAKLRRQKRQSAVMSQFGGATGIGALGALALSRHPKLRKVRNVQTPLLTAGAGVGGINAFTGAAVQRKEAQATIPRPVKKALVPTGVRRAPAMRMGHVRQTRYANGRIRVSTVRGGLS